MMYRTHAEWLSVADVMPKDTGQLSREQVATAKATGVKYRTPMLDYPYVDITW
jgi:hypothetical protein